MPKTPGLNLPYGIDPVNPVPVDANYGPYTNTAQAIAAIPLALRYDGLTVQITGSGNYWWLAADLTDTGLIAKSMGGGGGSTPVNITYAALAALQSGGTLAPGTLYKITDRDLGIYIRAISVTEFDTRGVRVMLTPKFDGTNVDLFGTWFSWMADYTPAYVGSYVVWGGSLWQNVNGNTGAPIDDLTLDSEWNLIPKGSGEDAFYGLKTFDVEYDVANDFIIKQWDHLGNIFGPYTADQINSFGYNPTDIAPWNSFKDVNYVYTPGLNGLDYNFICYNNEFKGSYKNIPFFDDASTVLCIIRHNSFINFEIGTIWSQSIIENNINLSYLNVNDLVISSPFNNTNYSINGMNPIYPDIGFTAHYRNTNCTIIDSNVLSINDCYYVSVTLSTGSPSISISNSSNITLDTGTSITGTISGCKNLYLNSSYANVNEIINENPSAFTVPTGASISKTRISTENIVYQYVEFTTSLLGPGFSIFSGRIIKSNCRLINAVMIVNFPALTGSPKLEFGVETDAEGYIPELLISILNTTPQTVDTVSGILTVDKRFYLKNTATAGNSVGPNPGNSVKVWVKMITF